MILDESLEFADATTIVGATGRALIGDVVDLGENHRDPGNGEPLYLVIQVTEDADSAADTATVSFELVSDAQAAIAVDGSATEHFVTPAIAQATLVAGYVAVVIALPMEGAVYERFLGVIANVGTEATTGGAINAFLTRDVSRWQAYPSPSQGVFVDA